MTRYDLLLFLHISFAVLWVGGAAMMQFYGLRAIAARSGERLATFARDTEWIALRVLTPVALGAFLSGLALVWDAEFLGFGEDWIVIGLGLFAVTFLSGLLFFAPESGRVGKVVAAEGVDSPVAQARLTRLIVLSRIDLVVLLLIIFDMAVKPSFSDGWTIAGALIAAAGLSALLFAGGRPRPLESPAAG